MDILQSRRLSQIGCILLCFLAAIANLDLHYSADLLRRRSLALSLKIDFYH